MLTPILTTIFSPKQRNILDELDDIDELGAMSPDSYLAPDADIESANMDSFLENSSQNGTMSDDDDDVAIPKGKSIAHHNMPSELKGHQNSAIFFQNFLYMVTSRRYFS